jgi:microsomal dipeptidase-like Zn-dependent dipeptidase
MLGFSLYPHHLKDKGDCSLNSFCEMVARTVDMIGIKHVGIGSDLCTGQPDSVVDWMRNGKWTKNKDYGEGSAMNAGFPEQPSWFKDASGFGNLEKGLYSVGFQETEVNDILGNNWYNFYRGINS